MAIFSGLGALISGALFGGSLLAAKLIGGALAFGAQLGLGKLTNKQQKKQKFTAVQGEVQMGGDVPVDALLGTGKARGQRAYYAKWGKGNKVNADVFILANGWCDGLENYCYFYGEKKNLVARPLIGGEVAHLGVDGFGDLISIRFYDGRPGQPVDQKLVNDTAGLGKTWKATSRLSGLTYVVVERRYDSSKFDKGRPEFEWVLRGLREYDPTKDSTVAGGNGPQRLNDPSTWTHTLNPAIHRLNYQLGLRGLRSGRTLIGEGKSLGQLDLSSYFVAINYCRTLRKGKPIYQCSLWVNSETDHTEALSAFDDAMAGYGLNRRGLSGVVVGAPQIPVLEITEKDIPADRPKPRQPRKSAFDLFNHLSGQFTSPEAMWNPESLKPIVVNADVAADKRARQTSIDFLQVSDADIAQYLLNVRYRQNRKGGTATVPVSRRVGLKAMEGEWVSYLGKVWMISEWRCDEDLRFTFVLTEAGADIYDDGDIEPGPVVIPPTPPLNPSLLSVIQNFDVEVGLISGANGSQVPCLRFTWTPPEDPTIVSVNITYEVDGGTQRFSDVSTDPESGLKLTTDNVVSGKIYRAKATITTAPDRFRTETPWRTTAAPTPNLSVLDNSITASKIADAAVTAEKIMNEAVTSLKIAERAVSSAKIAVGAITEELVANSAISANKIAEQAIGLTKFAAGITPVEIISGALPTTGNFEGRQAFFNGKLYRFTGGNWTSATSAGDVVGQITGTQIADDAITSPKIAANAITASELAAFSVVAGKVAAAAIGATEIQAAAITADKMAVGKGKNLLRNTEFYGAWQGWLTWNQNGIANRAFTFNLAGDPWALATQPRTMVLGQNDANADPSVLQVATGRTLSVIAGKRYEAFIFVAAHRCPAYIGISWFDAAGNFISESVSSAYSGSFGGTALSGYYQLGLMATAPANAVVAELYIRKQPTVAGNANSYVFVVRPYFGEAGPNQVAYSDWEPGGFTFIGPDYLATGAVIADKVAAGAITTEKLNAASVTADKIAFGAITGDKIMAAAITGEKIAAGSVGANHIAANSITAKQLVLTDFSNIIVNDFTTGLTDGWTLYGQNKGIFNSAAEAGADYGGWRVYGDERNVAISAVYPCQAGDVFFASVWCWNWVSTYPAYLSIEFLDEAGGSSQFATVSSVPANTGWVKLSGRVTAPSGKSKMRMFLITDRPWGVYGNPVHWSKPVLRRAASAELIVDGSITANKLSVNSLSAISANFGDAYFSGIARSVNGKLLLDFNNGGMEVFT